MKKAMILVLIFAFVSVGSAGTIISAKDLYALFEKNEISAEARYKGKTVSVAGKISSISKNILGQPIVTLDAGSLNFVNCRFDKEDVNQLLDLQKGQDAKFHCRINGKTFTAINLYECKPIR